MRVRYESFGGIIGVEKPPFLAFINKAFMRKLGYSGSKLWDCTSDSFLKDRKPANRPFANRLSAPTEIHFSITNKCNQQCKHCYTNSVKDNSDELSTGSIKQFIDIISEMGVFHIALGGGESLLRDDLFEIAQYIRKMNMVPNLTTNGLISDKNIAKECRVFGQINVSLDTLNKDDFQPRTSTIENSLSAIELLRETGNKVGINCVVNRLNFQHMKTLVKFAKKNRLRDIEFLRLKPVGRAVDIYNEICCTDEQNKEFFLQIIDYSRTFRQDLKLDCSYIPMVCYHEPDVELMKKFHIRGCDGGNLLAFLDAKGIVSACSFYQESAGYFSEFNSLWNESNELNKFFEWQFDAPEPCKSCAYLSICNGGCHAVSEFLTGSFHSSDPECPIVLGKR